MKLVPLFALLMLIPLAGLAVTTTVAWNALNDLAQTHVDQQARLLTSNVQVLVSSRRRLSAGAAACRQAPPLVSRRRRLSAGAAACRQRSRIISYGDFLKARRFWRSLLRMSVRGTA